MDPRLIAMLVCPICKGALKLRPAEPPQAPELVCTADRLAFPVRDGIPVMLEDQARALAADESPS